MYEIFPITQTEPDLYKYDEPVWIPKSAIGEHYSVHTKNDFHNAWISLGFQPEVGENDIWFRKLFEHEHDDTGAVDSLSSNSDTCSDIRSNHSWSTEESGSLSFVTDTAESGDPCEDPDCEFCKETQENQRWFRHAWQPTDPTEAAVKRVIEQLEEKYT
jgi:hypothetical protein